MDSKRRSRRLAPFVLFLVITILGVSGEARAQGVGASGSNGVPCAALADAVISTTGNIYLNAATLVDSYQ